MKSEDLLQAEADYQTNGRVASGRTHSPAGLELEGETTGCDHPRGPCGGADSPAVQTLQVREQPPDWRYKWKQGRQEA